MFGKNNLTLAAFLLLLLFNFTYSPGAVAERRIENPISWGWELKPGEKKPTWRGWKAQIAFSSLPAIDQATTVQVKFKRSSGKGLRKANLRVSFIHHSIDYTQLSPPLDKPIGKGGVYEGHFTFTPHEIGTFKFRVAADINFNGHFDFDYSVYFTIDESGRCVHLWKWDDDDYSGPPPHPPVSEKEIILRYNPGRYAMTFILPFFRITPPPTLNDTSLIEFELIADRDYPRGVRFKVGCPMDLKVVGVPPPWLGYIKKGDTYRGSFKIVPTEIGATYLAFVAWGPTIPDEAWTEKEGSCGYRIHFILDESGKLEYIGRYEKIYRSSGYDRSKSVYRKKRHYYYYQRPEGN